MFSLVEGLRSYEARLEILYPKIGNFRIPFYNNAVLKLLEMSSKLQFFLLKWNPFCVIFFWGNSLIVNFLQKRKPLMSKLTKGFFVRLKIIYVITLIELFIRYDKLFCKSSLIIYFDRNRIDTWNKFAHINSNWNSWNWWVFSYKLSLS